MSENLELIKRARNGDKLARDKLADKNIPLVKSIAKKYLGRGIEYDDLMQTGLVGLIKAIDGFDVSRNVQFSTYAFPMVLGEIKKLVRDYNTVKIPRSIKELQQKVNYYSQQCQAESGTVPTVEQIAKKLNCKQEDVVIAIESQNCCSSLDEKTPDGLGIIDTVAAEERIKINDKLALYECLKRLDERSRKVILLRFFREKTQTDVANMLGISQVQVSRIESKALKTLKQKMG